MQPVVRSAKKFPELPVRLFHKILLAMFVSTALVLLVNAIVARQALGGGFKAFLEQQEQRRIQDAMPELIALYRQRDDWQAVQREPRLLFDALRPTRDGRSSDRPPRRDRNATQPRQPRPRARPSRNRSGPPSSPQDFHRRLVLLNADRHLIIGNPNHTDMAQLAVADDDQIIGWVGVSRPRGSLAPEEQAFLDRQLAATAWALGIGLLLAGLLAWLLARHLSRPVSQVANALHDIAGGNFERRVAQAGRDEIAELGRDVNQLAATLAANESSRRRWTADVAHELRTPLAILKGELEAIEDGIREPNQAAIDSLREETRLLGKLVDDLHQLSLADAGALDYRMDRLDLAEQLSLLGQRFEDRIRRSGLKLDLRIPKTPVWINADATRIQQLMNNLLENAIRYTDDGGLIRVQLLNTAQLTFDDSPPGIDPQDYERLFDRFFRAEPSRNRRHGGSGLGLAICKKIAQAHNATICAEPGPLGGLRVRVQFSVASR